ncbi:hypothetical protein SLEP1_g15169 [Rubroshorea leprosula]|uniref:Uncharacterized protein n=1 Tax=Rubroshorea leprosula TaxID=152421 RepID=A0AAV5ISE6_9ROSI|nr:hypothetical protein SLEP1_g15169 [Rubroshorea leprosula]
MTVTPSSHPSKRGVSAARKRSKNSFASPLGSSNIDYVLTPYGSSKLASNCVASSTLVALFSLLKKFGPMAS